MQLIIAEPKFSNFIPSNQIPQVNEVTSWRQPAHGYQCKFEIKSY